MMNNNKTTLITIALPDCNRAMRKNDCCQTQCTVYTAGIKILDALKSKKERKTRLATKITDIRKQGIIFVIGYKIAAKQGCNST